MCGRFLPSYGGSRIGTGTGVYLQFRHGIADAIMEFRRKYKRVPRAASRPLRPSAKRRFQGPY